MGPDAKEKKVQKVGHAMAKVFFEDQEWDLCVCEREDN